MRAARLFFGLAFVLGGCGAIIGVKDLTYDENAANDGGGSDGSKTDGPSADGTSGDGGADGNNCVADFQTDKKNCGRCGHDCGGGDCTAGKCQPIQIGAVASAPLNYLHVSPANVYVSTLILYTTESGGIWRVPKSGGTPEPYVTLRYAEQMVAVGNLLYFVVEDDPAPAATGGFYSCPLDGPAPCTPTMIASADNPRGITVDQGKVYYGDQATGKGVMEYVPGGTPTVYRAGYGHARWLTVSGQAAFYNVTISQNTPQHGRFIEILPDAGFEIRYDYSSNTANAGPIFGTSSAVLITSFDYDGPTSKGVVHRYPRAGGVTPCDYGADSNKRPHGVIADDKHLYWANLGDGTKEPYTGGSIAMCPLEGCCTTPETLWTGDGEPSGIALDDAFVYWVTEKSNAVWKVAKP